MRKSLSAVLLSFSLAAAPLAARADEPSDRAAKILGSLPEPSDAEGFKFKGEFFVQGMRIGTMSSEATSAKADGKPVWNVVEEMKAQMGEMKMAQRSVASLAQDLHLLRIETSSEENGKTKSSKVVRTETGFDVAKKTDAGDEKSELKADASTTATFAGVLMFLRACPAESATYAVTSISTDKLAIEEATLEVAGPGKFTEGTVSLDAWVVHGKKADEKMDFYLNPSDRSLIAFRMPSNGMMVVKAGVMPAASQSEGPDTSKPAASAAEAGARFALGASIGDEALVSAALHWPTLHADAMKANPAVPADLDAFKALVLEQMRPKYQKMDKATAWAVVGGAMKAAKETLADDLTVVTFGPPMDGFTFSAKQIDGIWYMVKMPGK